MPTPLEISRTATREITITWDDGHVSVYPTRLLRLVCGCAGCVDEWTGARRLDSNTISETIDLVEAELVGGYAVRFVFTDTHGDGIYSYRRLREHCPCAECAGKAQ
jgi:DUF971 family protein